MLERNFGLVYMMYVFGGCMEDIGDCCYVFCCLVCYMGLIVDRMNMGSFCMMVVIASCFGLFLFFYLKCVVSKVFEFVGVKLVGYVEFCFMLSCVVC